MAIIPPDEDIQRIRQKMMERKSGAARDAHEYRFPKAPAGEVISVYGRILPPTEAMGDLWFYVNGHHYIDNKHYECPRIHDRTDCPLCQFGFELMEGMDKQQKSTIAKQYLARTYYAVNVYFPNVAAVPEDLRGKVMWCNIPSTLYAKCENCIMADNEGDPSDPQPFGLFYSVSSGYVMKVIIKEKGGYNNYEESKFLVNTKGPLTKNEAQIAEILAKRHDLPTKFAARDLEALQAVVDRLAKKGGGGEPDAGFDETSPAKPKAGKPAPKKEEELLTDAEDEVHGVIRPDADGHGRDGRGGQR